MGPARRALLAGLLAAAAAIVLFGTDPDSGVPLTVLALVVPVGAGLAILRPRRRWRGGDGWRAPAAPIAFTGRGAPPSGSRVALALGRAEAREMAGSGAFGVGLGFCALVAFLFGWAWTKESVDTWEGILQLAPWFAHPLAGLTVLAAHRAVTRPRRDGTAELFDTCPADPAARTAGHLVAAWVPMAALTVLFAVLVVLMGWRSHLLYGPLTANTVFDVLAAIALGAGAVTLGVALARWAAFPLVPVVAVVGVGIGTLSISNVGGHDWNPLVYLGTAPTIEGPTPMFVVRPAAWHLVWIVGLVGVFAVLAVARDRRDRPVQAAAALVVVVALVGGLGATRSMGSADAALIADRVAHPEAHQRCATVATRVDVCLFDLHWPLVDEMDDRLRAVAAALPPDHPTYTVRQVFLDELRDLPPEVRRRLAPDALRRPAHEVPLQTTSDFRNPVIDPAFDLALTATGLPTRPTAGGRPLVVSGEARGVVALWLASRGLFGFELSQVTSSPAPDSPNPYDQGSLEVGDCSEPSVVWSEQDLLAARLVVALGVKEAAPVLYAQWHRWVDPATGTDELLAALGLRTVGPFDVVLPQPGNPC